MSAWGQPPKTGAWAAQVDEEEEENGGELAPPPAVEFPALGGDAQAFPSLGETAGMKESKRDRKKRQVQKMSLGAFVSAGRKEVDVVNLPTAPRARADGDEEKKDGLGGGFRNYGGDRGGGFDRFRDREDDRGFRREEDEGPSRADAADDWGSKKAFVPSGGSSRGFGGGGFGDRERDRGSGGFGDRYTERRSGFTDDEPGRADDADRWGSKNFEPSSRRGGFEERTSSFGSKEYEGPSRADTEDKWSRAAPLEPSSGSGRWGSGSSGSAAGGPPSAARPRLNLKPRSAELPPLASGTSNASAPSEAGSEGKEAAPRASKPNPFGEAKPVEVVDRQELSRTSSSRSLKSEAEAAPPVPSGPPKPRPNPFGAARPREEVLKEKGVDPAKLESAAPEDSAKDSPAEPASATRSGDGEVNKESVEEEIEQQRARLENGGGVSGAAKTGGSWAKVASKPTAEAAAPET